MGADRALQKPREPREAVNITVRIRTDHGWNNADIRNVSARGLMAVCDTPPQRGSYVEIRRGSYIVVGRVAWASYDRFGLRSQDRIVVTELARLHPTGRASQNDRRATPRKSVNVAPRRQSLQERQAASARFARAFQFIAIVAVAGGVSVAIADTVFGILAKPIIAIEQALGAQPAG